MNKKTLIPSILITTTLLLSACAGKNEPVNSSTPNNKEEIITLKVAHNMDFTTIPEAIIEAGNRVNAEYAKEGLNKKIEFITDYQTIDWNEYNKKMIFAHQSKDAPDIYTAGNIQEMVKAGVAMDLTDWYNKNQNNFVANSFTSATVDKKVYGMPMDVPVRVIYYNKNILKAYGWTDEKIAALPKQIAEGTFTLEDFMQLTTDVMKSGKAKYGLVHRPGAGNDFLDMFMALGGQYYNDQNQLVFDEDGLTKFFQFTYDNANTSRITPQNLNQLGWDTINGMVGKGEAFAYYGPIFSSTYAANAGGLNTQQLADQEEFVLFPASKDNKKPFVTAAPQNIAVSPDTKHPEEVLDILTELATNSTDLMANHAGKTLSYSSVIAANNEKSVTENQVLSASTYMIDHAVFPLNVDGLATYNSELFKQIVSLELGQTTPEKAVNEMKTQIQLNVKNVEIK